MVMLEVSILSTIWGCRLVVDRVICIDEVPGATPGTSTFFWLMQTCFFYAQVDLFKRPNAVFKRKCP